MNDDECQDSDLNGKELRDWLEIGSWTTLALAPFLYWINGPAVSSDQFVVRTTLMVVAAVAAIALRLAAWFKAG
jgi:hypothetical protein